MLLLARQARVEEELARTQKTRRGRRALLESAALGAVRLARFSGVAQALRAAGVEFVVLKGMAYALMFERGGPLRPMADCDLLVREADFARAGEVMQEIGFRESFPDPLSGRPGHHERAFTGEGMLVEIHRAFMRGPRARIDYRALWARTLPLERENVACRRLDADDTFLYHCFHFAIHEFALGGLRAVWELRRLILEDGPRLDACARRAREWGIRRAVFSALRLYQACFPDPAERDIGDTGSGRGALTSERIDPAAWAEAFAPPPPARALLERLVIAPSLSRLLVPGPLPRPAQLLRKTLLVDSLGAAGAYLGWYLWRRLGP